jgi:hypothetical protein
VPEGPDATSKGRGVATSDAEVEVVTSGDVCGGWFEFAPEQETSQAGEHLDVEQVRSLHLPGEGIEQLVVGLAADQGLDHRGGIDDDH